MIYFASYFETGNTLSIPITMLKPQDTIIALKLWADYRQGVQMPLRQAASLLGISNGEFSKGLRRLETAQLVTERDGQRFAEAHALLEWLNFGVRYAYPAESIGFGRGMPTAWNCQHIESTIVPPIPALVWSQPKGNIEGIFISPLHGSAVIAASNNALLHHVLALVDAVRLGKPRELKVARELLTSLIKGKV